MKLGARLCTYDVICESLHNFVFLFCKRFLPKDFRPSSLLAWSESESCSVVSNSAIPWTVACPVLYPWNSPSQNAGVGSLFLLQGIFPTQGLNPGLPHCGWILYQLSHKGSPRILEWVAYPFSSRSSRLRNQPGVLLYCQANSLPTGSTFMTYWGGNNHHRPLLFFDTNNGKRYEFKKEILDFFYSQ